MGVNDVFTWEIGLLVSIGLLWFGAWGLLRSAADADARELRRREDARRRFGRRFE